MKKQRQPLISIENLGLNSSTNCDSDKMPSLTKARPKIDVQDYFSQIYIISYKQKPNTKTALGA